MVARAGKIRNRRREAESARARLIATVAAPPDDPQALAKGQKILESLRRQRASMVSGRTPTDGYRGMAADKEREDEAMEWCNAFAGDMANAAR